MIEKQRINPAAKRAYVYTGYWKHNNYIAGSSHNLYSRNCGDNHKIIAPQQASSDDWDDERIKATLWPERRQQIVESITEFVIYALFGAMIVLALFT